MKQVEVEVEKRIVPLVLVRFIGLVGLFLFLTSGAHGMYYAYLESRWRARRSSHGGRRRTSWYVGASRGEGNEAIRLNPNKASHSFPAIVLLIGQLQHRPIAGAVSIGIDIIKVLQIVTLLNSPDLFFS